RIETQIRMDRGMGDRGVFARRKSSHNTARMLDERRHGFTRFAPAGEVPGVGKAGALARFHGLDGAVAPLEEDADVVLGAVGGGRALDEREAISLRAQGGEALNEIVLRKPEVRGDRRGLVGVDFY